ncbi:hypothetical protein [Streptomyces decoyicus]|uniref:hypothetical protein n=1 Tax=Streptomyces decoyicus TaxID=249567 RepID=UPI0033A8F181
MAVLNESVSRAKAPRDRNRRTDVRELPKTTKRTAARNGQGKKAAARKLAPKLPT